MCLSSMCVFLFACMCVCFWDEMWFIECCCTFDFNVNTSSAREHTNTHTHTHRGRGGARPIVTFEWHHSQQSTNHSRRRVGPEVLARSKNKMAEKVHSAPFDIKVSPRPLSSFLEQLMEDISNDLQTAAGMYATYLHSFLLFAVWPAYLGTGLSAPCVTGTR